MSIKKKKKKKKDTFAFKKILKCDKYTKNIINHLTRNSKAIYNTSLYYAKKILSRDRDFLNKYNENSIKYKNIQPNKLSINGLSMYIATFYDNYKFMSNHISQQTIKRAFKGFVSYFALRKKNIRTARLPKYVKKNGRYNVFFTKNIFKKMKYNNKCCIRLSLGKHIQSMYAHLSKNKYLNNLNKKLYYDKKYIVNKKQKIKGKIYKKVGDNQYVNKNKIIDGRHLYVNIPEYIYKKDLVEVEIKPIFNGLQYELIVKYQTDKIKVDKKIKKVISIDLGLNNLFAVFGTHIKPFIVNGRPLKSINQYYNKLISKIQNKRDTVIRNIVNKTKRYVKFIKYIYKRQIRILYHRRNKKINYESHKITHFLTKYCIDNKIDTVLIGYIKGWKQHINMGSKNNQNFAYIPFYNIINKLKYKLYQFGIKILLHNESYTSKCDALNGEMVGPHNKYDGKRIKRGLFRSKYKKTLINADINGAINIYRKAFLTSKKKNDLFTIFIRKIRKKLQQVKKYTLKSAFYDSSC